MRNDKLLSPKMASDRICSLPAPDPDEVAGAGGGVSSTLQLIVSLSSTTRADMMWFVFYYKVA